jgi:uncharacterized Zn finger protein
MARYDDFDRFRYVPAAERRLNAERAVSALRKGGAQPVPVVIEGRGITQTFWGQAWCRNLERYGDYANRLPRGRSYVRSGAVVDLQITPGSVVSRVSGSELYRATVTVAAVPSARWTAICRDCAGEIESVVALLQGRLSEKMMARLFDRDAGLFPAPREIRFTCSCPDRAMMCKHVAATLYGIGARLDREPALLFVLRQVNQDDLIARVGVTLERAVKAPIGTRILEADLSTLFGIEISDAIPRPARVRRPSDRAAEVAPSRARRKADSGRNRG